MSRKSGRLDDQVNSHTSAMSSIIFDASCEGLMPFESEGNENVCPWRLSVASSSVILSQRILHVQDGALM